MSMWYYYFRECAAQRCNREERSPLPTAVRRLVSAPNPHILSTIFTIYSTKKCSISHNARMPNTCNRSPHFCCIYQAPASVVQSTSSRQTSPPLPDPVTTFSVVSQLLRWWRCCHRTISLMGHAGTRAAVGPSLYRVVRYTAKERCSVLMPLEWL